MFDLIKQTKRSMVLVLLIEAIVCAAFILGNIFLIDKFAFLGSQEAYLGVLGFIFIFPCFFIAHSIRKTEKGIRKNYITIANTLGADISEAYSFGEIGIISYNARQEIIWTSNLFSERGIKLLGLNVVQRFPVLRPFFNNSSDNETPKEIKVVINQRTYSVIHLIELSVLIFKDVSEVDSLYLLRQEEAPVIVTILLDNLGDVTTIANDEDYVQIEALIRKSIADWARENKVLLKKIKDDVYFGFMQETSYQSICNGQFRLLNDVSKLSSKKEITFTISLGFGRGINNFAKLSELSAAAIDVAQSRGGNQVVINNFGGHMEFFGGGGMEVKARRNAVRNRVLAQSFYAHIQTYKTVLIVPHVEADFDAIGAALGVLAVAKSAGKQALMVYDEKQIEVKARLMLKDLFNRTELEMLSVSPAKAVEMVGEDTLVVAVDVNRPNLTTAPKLLEKAQNVAVIDHHRRAEDAIDNPIFNHIDTVASSASELVMEMITNAPVKIVISSKVATYMLAGILLDTNGFKARTTTATFRAAMNLKDAGADNTVADSYLKDEYEEFALKTKIMSNIESPYFGIMIAMAPANQIIDRTMLAKVGQEIVGVKGVKAAFVIGYISDRAVGISARSDGTVNVQLIMEKMGGGGHHSGAAAQISNSKPEDVCESLKKILELYINDIQ